MKLTIKQKKFADEYIISGNAYQSSIKNNLCKYCYGIIYMIHNMVNQKKYIGVTTRTINQRFDEHSKAESYIGRAIRKYGKDNFAITIIDYADNKDNLMELEKYYIKKHNSKENGYNLTIGGDGVTYVNDIELKHTNEQVRFIEYMAKENKKEIDINDEAAMVNLIIKNLLHIYLIATKPYDKIKISQLIMKLDRKYLASILRTRLVTYEEVRHYANQKVSSFEVIKR